MVRTSTRVTRELNTFTPSMTLAPMGTIVMGRLFFTRRVAIRRRLTNGMQLA